MALLRLNSNKLQLELSVGVCESYKPTKKIKSLSNKVDELRKGLESDLLQMFGTSNSKEVSEIVSKDKEKDEELKKYLLEKLNPEIQNILKEIHTINEQICPNFAEINKAK